MNNRCQGFATINPMTPLAITACPLYFSTFRFLGVAKCRNLYLFLEHHFFPQKVVYFIKYYKFPIIVK